MPGPFNQAREAVNDSGYAQWFRDSTPYISMHRNRTFVVLLDGAALDHGNLTNIVHDLALVHVLGARVVLVHGARPQLDRALQDPRFINGRRITRHEDLPVLLGVLGEARTRLEALFSTGLPTSPLRQTDIAVVSGNFVTARPVGAVDGVDHLLTGRVRRIHSTRINAALAAGALVLLSPVGYSSSGQVFNLAADELATDVALALNAEKLIVFSQAGALIDDNGERISVTSPAELPAHLDDADPLLHSVLRACRGGVKSCQMVSWAEDGALLTELFTAAGCGTQIRESFGAFIRNAAVKDVNAIVEVIRPLEESGILVRRSRDRLEEEIDQFLVADIDDNVVGCCAVYPFGETAELACVAVHASYRDTPHFAGRGPGVGTALLKAAEVRALQSGALRMFALTTQTSDWFLDNGFTEAPLTALPDLKQDMYNYQRNARVMIKELTA